MEIRERIEHVLRAQNITATQLAEMMGIQRSGISHILSGRNNPSMDFIVKFKESFPEYNLEWLLMGIGPKTGFEQNRQQKLASLQPSLFESEIGTENGNPDEKGISGTEDTIKKEPEIIVKKENFVPQQEASTTETKTATATNEQLLRSNTSNKKVIKIALFYRDGTFEVFDSE